ncbi:hypothetical protein V3N99_08235 [Dermatophilaceae bacterium Soc4.6]
MMRTAAIPVIALAVAIIAGPRLLVALAVAAAPSLIEATALTARAYRSGIVSVTSARDQLHASGVRDVLEVGNLVAGAQTHETVVLLRRLLRAADAAETGLVVAARDSVRPKYVRLGWQPVAGAPHTLTRPPQGKPARQTAD